jgi:type I restriction enzyme, R subunit
VQLYEALDPVCSMKPVVVIPSITFAQLAEELESLKNDRERTMVAEQFLASRAWTKPQQDWLKRIAKAIKENEIVDRPLFEEGAFQSAGGFGRIDKVFDGKLAEVVGQLHEAVRKIS